MSDLIPIASLTMSSVEIAELAGKHHKHVVRDLKYLEEQGVLSLPKFGHTIEIKGIDGRVTGKRTIYRLPKRETLILTSGYSAVQRAAIIDRMLELEEGAISLENERLREALLDSNPFWRKIARCRLIDLNTHEIARVIECGETTVRRHIAKMREYGLLPSASAESKAVQREDHPQMALRLLDGGES